MTDELLYDFICLCCGGVNGEEHAQCTVRDYPLASDDPGPGYGARYNYAAWFDSGDYRGSVIVPAGFEMTREHREVILGVTSSVSSTGLVLFKLPVLGEDVPGISISGFLN